MSSHARHNDARRYQEAFGGTHAQALRQVREQLPPAREASRALDASRAGGSCSRTWRSACAWVPPNASW